MQIRRKIFVPVIFSLLFEFAEQQLVLHKNTCQCHYANGYHSFQV